MPASSAHQPLAGIHVLSLAPNVPGPVALAQLVKMGATGTKIESPHGDPLAAAAPQYYRELTAGIKVLTVNLTEDAGRAQLAELLAHTDILLTSSRPSALAKMGINWPELSARWPRLSLVSIVGQAGANAEIPGHDLTYQAKEGLIATSDGQAHLPVTLMADLAGAQQAVSTALAALFARERTGTGGAYQVSLSSAATEFAAPHRYGLTRPGGPLGGGLPQYQVYPAKSGFVAIAALEPHFWKRLCKELTLDGSPESLAAAMLTRTAEEWERWAAQRDLPLAACTLD